MSRDYVTVNIPIEWKPYIEKLLENQEIKKRLEMMRFTETPSGLGKLIIFDYLIEHTDFRFESFNFDENGVKIQDRKLNIIAQIYFKPDKVFCEYDETHDCEHVKFALSIPKVQQILRKKGWDPK